MPANPETIFVWKYPRTTGGITANNTAAGFEDSLWQLVGQPTHGAIPPTTPGANPTNATPGGIRQTDPGVGLQKWLTSMTACVRSTGRIVVYDRLYHVSGFSGINTGVQNCNGGSPATLSRHYPNPLGNTDDGNEIFLEVYTSVGTTPQIATVSYVSSAGAPQSATGLFGGSTRNLGQKCCRMNLALGDTGVQSVTSVQLAGSTGTAGNFGLVVAHRLLELEISSTNGPETWSGIDGQFKEILAGACLAFTFCACGASSNNVPAGFLQLNFGDV